MTSGPASPADWSQSTRVCAFHCLGCVCHTRTPSPEGTPSRPSRAGARPGGLGRAQRDHRPRREPSTGPGLPACRRAERSSALTRHRRGSPGNDSRASVAGRLVPERACVRLSLLGMCVPHAHAERAAGPSAQTRTEYGARPPRLSQGGAELRPHPASPFVAGRSGAPPSPGIVAGLLAMTVGRASPADWSQSARVCAFHCLGCVCHTRTPSARRDHRPRRGRNGGRRRGAPPPPRHRRAAHLKPPS